MDSISCFPLYKMRKLILVHYLLPFLFLPTSKLLSGLCVIDFLFCLSEIQPSVLCLKVDSKSGKLVNNIFDHLRK